MDAVEVVISTSRGQHSCTMQCTEDSISTNTDLSWAHGMNVTKQSDFDAKLNTPFALLTSIAFARAGANFERISEYAYFKAKLEATGLINRTRISVLPLPVFTIFSGGVDGGNTSPIRGVAICPLGAATFAEAARMASEIFHIAKHIVQTEQGFDAGNVSIHGGLCSPSASIDYPLDVTHRAIIQAKAEGRAELWIDIGAEDLYKANGHYELSEKSIVSTEVTPTQLLGLYRSWCERYPIWAFEDPFYAEPGSSEEDRNAWKETASLVKLLATARYKRVPCCGCPIVGLDASHTLAGFAEHRAELRGIGTLAIRSDTTVDPKEATLAAVAGVEIIRCGAIGLGQTSAKVNELIRIEEELAPVGKAAYGKKHVFE